MLLLLLGGAVNMHAQEKKPCVVVWYQSGEAKYEQYSFMMENHPKIQLLESGAVIKSEGSYEYSYNEYESYTIEYDFSISWDDAEKYSLTVEERAYAGYYQDFNDESTRVQEVNAKLAKPSFRVTGDRLVVNGIEAESPMEIFDTTGKSLGKALAGANGSASLQLPHVTGTVIVKTNGVTFKILAR